MTQLVTHSVATDSQTAKHREIELHHSTPPPPEFEPMVPSSELEDRTLLDDEEGNEQC
ncbi:MAG: hypothetical protein V2I43_05545 [Parvularcula sp.]|nr:hypothetical protein [Parvularcula sp.]